MNSYLVAVNTKNVQYKVFVTASNESTARIKAVVAVGLSTYNPGISTSILTLTDGTIVDVSV